MYIVDTRFLNEKHQKRQHLAAQSLSYDELPVFEMVLAYKKTKRRLVRLIQNVQVFRLSKTVPTSVDMKARLEEWAV